jgi:hypothetical protein
VIEVGAVGVPAPLGRGLPRTTALDRRGIQTTATILGIETDPKSGLDTRTHVLVEYVTREGKTKRAELSYDEDLVADRGSQRHVEVVYDRLGDAVAITGSYSTAVDLAWVAGILLTGLTVAATPIRNWFWIDALRALPLRGGQPEPWLGRFVNGVGNRQGRAYVVLSAPGKAEEWVPVMHIQGAGSLARGQWPATVYRGPGRGKLLIQANGRFVWPSAPLLWPLRGKVAGRAERTVASRGRARSPYDPSRPAGGAPSAHRSGRVIGARRSQATVSLKRRPTRCLFWATSFHVRPGSIHRRSPQRSFEVEGQSDPGGCGVERKQLSSPWHMPSFAQETEPVLETPSDVTGPQT